MSRNFYWKEEVPKEIADIVSDKNRFVDGVDLFTNEDSIFVHIGKRSGGGMFCHQCGISFAKHGTARIHYGGPDISLLFNQGNFTEEEMNQRKIEYKNQQKMYYYDECPCCGNTFDKDKDIVRYICTFTWSMMLHKYVIMNNLDNPQKLIVDDEGHEMTCREFIENEFDTSKVEFQHATDFC